MVIYSHNLDWDSLVYLMDKLTQLFDSSHTRKEIQSRNEYSSLLSLYLSCPELFLNTNISKQIRPDFILYNSKRIGLEVTTLTTERDSVMGKIAKQNYGKGKSVEELRQSAFARHGDKAYIYRYSQIDNLSYIGSPVISLDEDKPTYINKIIQKFNSYKSIMGSFDEFILLCNTELLFDEHDTEEIAKELRTAHPNITGFTLYILRYTNDKVVADRVDL